MSSVCRTMTIISESISTSRSGTHALARTGLSGKMLTINRTHSSAVRHFYFNRIATLWNTANSVVNLSDPFPTIKHKLINFLWDHFLSNFNPTNTYQVVGVGYSYHLVCPCSAMIVTHPPVLPCELCLS